jgi:hypothetical protein
LELVGKFRAARRAGPRVAGRVSEGVSEFVGGQRKTGSVWRTAYRSRSRDPPTQTATRSPNTLTRPLTLADARWTRRPFAHTSEAAAALEGVLVLNLAPESEILTLLALLDRLCAMLTRLAHMGDRPGPAQTGLRERSR